MTALDHLLYAVLWLSFAGLHSVLAGAGVKRRCRRWLGASYRLVYNLVAVAHLAAVWGVGRFVLADGLTPHDRPLWLAVAMTALALAGLLVLLIALRGYDLGRFAGTAQLRDPSLAVEESHPEPLRVDGLNRYVRHPIYSGALMLLWGGVTDEFALATAAWASLYFVIGSRFEERRLTALYGEPYRVYRARVPGLVPWRLLKRRADPAG